MHGPRVTVLLPTYNRAEILPACIRKVISQDFSDWELIILDDCSDDRTPDIAHEYAVLDNRIFYHRNTVRKGTPVNRNAGIDQSRGELIFFIEDDLTLDPACLKLLVETYDSLKDTKPVGGVMPRLIEGGAASPEVNCENPMIFNRFTGEVFSNYSVICDHVVQTLSMHACSLYPKAVLESVGGYSSRYTGNYYREETDLDFRILRKGYTFFYNSRAFGYHNPIPRGSWKQIHRRMMTYYIIRNHVVFVVSTFGVRALYMVPFYFLTIVWRRLRILAN